MLCERAHFAFYKSFFEKHAVFIWQFSKYGGVGNERGNQPRDERETLRRKMNLAASWATTGRKDNDTLLQLQFER